MNERPFVDIFRKLLVDVADLLPKRRRVGGLKLYSIGRTDFRIPVITTETELNIWLKALGRKRGEHARKVLRGRLAMISPMSISLTGPGGDSSDYRYQLVLNVKALDGLLGHARKEFVDLNVDMDESLYLEASCVAYICHEFRHLAQIFTLDLSDYHSNRKKIPALINDRISHCGLRRYWLDEMAFQMGLYEKHYAGDPIKSRMLRMEKDALIVQLLSLDCWMSSFLSSDEKMAKLQEILFEKKKR